MDFLKETIASENIVAWIILVLLLILVIKFLKSAGKGLFLVVLICAGAFVLAQFFPEFTEPLVDFIRGGWLGDQR